MTGLGEALRVLGLDGRATADDVRRARRALARDAHPDAGGDRDRMQTINVAATTALRHLKAVTNSETSVGAASTRDAPSRPEPTPPPADPTSGWDGVAGRRDVPSFVVEALPVETFEGLLFAAAELGEVADDDPPYELIVLMGAPTPCWCRLDVVPDAGASTVSLTVAAVPDSPPPPIHVVRNAWVTALNALDWSDL